MKELNFVYVRTERFLKNILFFKTNTKIEFVNMTFDNLIEVLGRLWYTLFRLSILLKMMLMTVLLDD